MTTIDTDSGYKDTMDLLGRGGYGLVLEVDDPPVTSEAEQAAIAQAWDNRQGDLGNESDRLLEYVLEGMALAQAVQKIEVKAKGIVLAELDRSGQDAVALRDKFNARILFPDG